VNTLQAEKPLITAESLIRGKSSEQRDGIIAAAKIAFERRMLEKRSEFFEPNGAVEKFVSAIAEEGVKPDGKWIFILSAANSIGKSCAGVEILVNLCYGPQNPFFDKPFFQKFPHPIKKFWYISEDSTLKDFVCGIDENVETEVSKWFPSGRYQRAKGGLDYFSVLTTDTGWYGRFKTYDQPVGKFESDKISVAIFDEPPPEGIFNAVVARLTFGGIILILMTPLYSAAWVKDRLIDNAEEKGNVYFQSADIEQNCFEHGIRGRLPHHRIQQIISQYDADEIAARAGGEFMYLQGLVFTGVHKVYHRHNLPISHFNQENFRIYCICDPHDAKPAMIAWFAMDRQWNVWGIDEYPEQMFHLIKNAPVPVPVVARHVMEYEQRMGFDPSLIVRVMDPNFGQSPSGVKGKTVAEYYASCGREIRWPLRFHTRVNDDLVAGHSMIRDWLQLDPAHATKLRISMKQSNLWYSLTHYAYIEDMGKRKEIHGMSERVQHKHKHGVDLIRYLLMYAHPPQKKKVPKRKAWYEEVMETQEVPVRKADWRHPHAIRGRMF
jgi:phage terminase large subunit-like protein